MRINPYITAQVLREVADEITHHETVKALVVEVAPIDAVETVQAIADLLRDKAAQLVREAEEGE